MKSPEEIKRMTSLLERLKVVMPERNAFGESNTERLASQIEILKRVSKTLAGGGDDIDIDEMLEEAYDDEDRQDDQDALNWVLENHDDDLTDEKEVAGWEAKRKPHEKKEA